MRHLFEDFTRPRLMMGVPSLQFGGEVVLIEENKANILEPLNLIP